MIEYFIVLGLVPGSFYGGLGIYRVYQGIRDELRPEKKDSPEESETKRATILQIMLHPTQAFKDEEKGHQYLRWFFGFAHLFVGGLFIACVEKTIQVNDIDMAAARLTDSGQLIPFLGGIMGMVCVLWNAVKWVYGHSENDIHTEDHTSKPSTESKKAKTKIDNQGKDSTAASKARVEYKPYPQKD